MTRADGTSNLGELARLIGVHAPYDGVFELRVPGVHAIRISETNEQIAHGLQQASVCIVAQGAKSVLIGEDVHTYDAGGVAVYSIDVPLAFQITRASRAEPYLNLKLDLDPQKVAELTLKVFPNGLPRSQESRALYIGQTDKPLVNASIRLLELMAQPEDAELLAPLVIDEILIRLLRSPIGSRVAQIGRAESSLTRVAKAVSWLRSNFDQPIDVDDLAKLVNMSVSAFHRQFKSVTSMSPLQYQKALRLQEARRLMLTAMLDAGDASRRVGYLSASQFSREYGRFFGNAPTKDIGRLRDEGVRQTGAAQ
ncbi:MAG: AraC family transcriptional regulator [Thermoanaerobaculia bacterium]